MFLIPITEDGVLKVTSKLKCKFSPGYDEIPEKLVIVFSLIKTTNLYT
jgi:hypothetical protein